MNLPPATEAKILTPFVPGQRHKAALDIAISMTGNHCSPHEVLATLHNKFSPELSDVELRGIVTWTTTKQFEPSKGNGHHSIWAPTKQTPPVPNRTPEQHTDWWTNGASLHPEDVVAKSPVTIPNLSSECCKLALANLFDENHNINVVCKFFKDKDKARPFGPGKSLNPDGWAEFITEHGVPHSEAGAWVRINPVNAIGTGKDGAITDADVAAFRYILVESDVLPLGKQLALFLKLRLPIAAIVLSAGTSAHCWVKVDCKDVDTYETIAKLLFAALKPFGVDESNKNPSRLCRLPGARRIIGATGDGEQKLIYLNPDCVAALTESLVSEFEKTLAYPCPLEKPLLPLAQDSLDRYAWMMSNVGKLGVPSGIPKLDSITGGWKKGHTIVIAGATNGGKTTLAMHMIVAALRAGYGVVLFSLEMDREEIFDLLVASECKINRNKFNNGRFFDCDIQAIGNGIAKLAQWPLFIEDSALSDTAQIKARVFQLQAENRIGLVVVDYIQFVNPEWGKDTREQQVAGISHDLRALARESRLPMIVLSQLNDEGRLRESRVIAHNANVVMQVELGEDSGKTTILKGRGIPYGEYHFKFDRMFSTLIPEPDNGDISEADKPRAYKDE